MSKRGHSGEWRSPDDKWPRHNSQWFREALDFARSAGWHFKESGGAAHIFGVVFCRKVDTNDFCSYVVFSTGEGGESAATGLRRKVEQCRHSATGPASRLEAATVKMTKAERLVDAAERLIDAHGGQQESLEAWARASELMDAAESDTAEIERLWEIADDADKAVALAEEAAQEALDAAETDDLDPRRIMDLAEATVSEVHQEAKSLPRSQAVRTLKKRIQQCRTRLAVVRSRLANG
ncbi:hypothetical protein ACTMTJ_34080 [Phytohabitans sp. LJ34]|uniref:hypothetical protein n=1 Tax=Phytohabitans sp. LJ34 TaxID=3452217 RepID=UPI003F887E92